jgi:membrane-bound ClpP family serine protease
METFFIIMLIVAGVALMLVELFLIPGISLAGAASLCCFLYAIYKAFAELGTVGGVVTLIVTLVACCVALNRFMRSKTLDRLALKQNIDSTVDKSNAEGVAVGDRGVAVTRLAQIGTAEINGKQMEVKSEDGFIDEKTPIRVTRIADNIFVKIDRDSD